MECKICNRVFANGKGLGGHMRSHYALLPLPPKRQDPISTDSSSSSESGGGDKSCLLSGVDPQSESESTRVTRGDEPLMSEEEAASCLVMLSRDVWRAPEESGMKEKTHECGKCEKVFKSAQGLGSHNSNHHHHHRKLRKSSGDHDGGVGVSEQSQNHECRFCGKVFSSAKALGGHKKVHSSSTIDLNLPPQIEVEDEDEKLE